MSRIELRWWVVTHTLPAAVLWDMDGTLVDTEPYWMTAQDALVHAWGGTWTHEDGLTLVGSGLWNAATIFQDRGVHLTADEIVDHLTNRVLMQLRESGVPWRPGARELLTELRDANVPTALVTMSVSEMAHHVADRLGFVGFDVVVSGNDVANAKPHPEPYLRAAELLGVEITQCVALEDSTPGVQSASSAGAVTIGVPFHVPIAESANYSLWPTLNGVSLEQIRSHVAAMAVR